jgi:hypothetical protein
VSSVSNDLYFLTLPLVSVMRVIYTSKGMSKKFGARYTLGARYISKNTISLHIELREIFLYCEMNIIPCMSYALSATGIKRKHR